MPPDTAAQAGNQRNHRNGNRQCPQGLLLLSATIAARTASTGDLTDP
jgi:hypothetical protein